MEMASSNGQISQKRHRKTLEIWRTAMFVSSKTCLPFAPIEIVVLVW